LSRSFEIGHEIGHVSHISNFTIGHISTAILFWLGPVQSAWGMISPNANTPVTEHTMAAHDGRSLSRLIGSASIAPALHNRRVTSIQWYWSITGKIFSAYFFASGLAFAEISKPNLSMEARPTVRPDINPPNRVRKIAIATF